MTNEKALNAFLIKKAEIENLLKTLSEYVSEDHCDVLPEQVNWSHVGSLNYVETQLQGVCDFLLLDTK